MLHTAVATPAASAAPGSAQDLLQHQVVSGRSSRMVGHANLLFASNK
jgi:hypothetical protein